MRKLTAASFLVVLVSAANASVIFNNGASHGLTGVGIETGSTALDGSTNAPAGTQWSELNQENSTMGSNVNGAAGFGIADDFVIPVGFSWTINSATLFVQQRFASPTTSPATGAFLRIWNGRPGDDGSSVLFGDLTTNLLSSSRFANIYRVAPSIGSSGVTPNLQRPVFELNANMGGFSLGSGRYWLEWRVTFADSGSASPFTPPLTPVNARSVSGANARVFLAGGWQNAVDLGVNEEEVGLDYPFVLSGTAVPEPGTMIALGAGALLLARRRRKA